MANRERRLERAIWFMRRDLQELGADLRSARLSAGLKLSDVGVRIAVSEATVMRRERGDLPGPRPEELARHAAAVGMRARIKVYPEGAPLRDTAQVELIRRFRERLKAPHRFAVEVPVTDDPGDSRAWDAVLELPGCTCALEFVTRFHDCQAQLRAFNLKLRDGRVDRLVVVAKSSQANRRTLYAARDITQANFPLGTRRTMASLAAGRDPGANALVLL